MSLSSVPRVVSKHGQQVPDFGLDSHIDVFGSPCLVSEKDHAHATHNGIPNILAHHSQNVVQSVHEVFLRRMFCFILQVV